MENINSSKFTTKENILTILVILFFITFFFPLYPVICNVVIGTIFVFSFFFNSLHEKWTLLKERKAVIFICAFYLLQVISAFLSINKDEAFTMLGMRVPLFLFPIALGTIYLRPALFDRLLFYIANLITIAAFVCFGWAAYQYKLTHDPAVLYNDSFSIAIEKQSIYFAMMVTLAIYFYFYLLIKKESAYSNKSWMYVVILFLMFTHFMLASRMNIIILYSSILLFAFYYVIRYKKVLEGATLIIGLLIGSFLLVNFFPKTINRFRELGYTSYNFQSHGKESHYNMEVTADQWNGANIRLAVWKCAANLIKAHPAFGVQIGDKQDQLVEEYKKNNFDFGVQSRRNTHNTYIDVLVTFGIVGLVLFALGFIILPFIQSFQNKFALGCIVIAVFVFVMFPETYLDRSLGNITMGFFLSLIIAAFVPKSVQSAKRDETTDAKHLKTSQ
ncbi:O-antigen ligase family protein [Chitinophagaceae bacterium 26-R-25]|nr:O-antigen ligase family protein [Chitinophagaceae bacterium 26-R-25]